MKNKIATLTLIVLSLVNVKWLAADGIEFIHDKQFQDILNMAKAENKLVFIDCYTTWCGPCKRLAANTFPDPQVGEFFNMAFINTKFDMEKGEGPSIASRYSVTAYPTMLWLDGDGNVKHKYVGGTDPAGLLEQGRKATDKTPEILNGMRKEYESGKRDVDFLSDYLNTLAKAGEKKDDVFKEYLGKLSSAELNNKKHAQTILNLTNDIKSPGISYLEKNMSNYKEMIGADVFNAKINSIATKAVSAAPRADDKTMFDQAINLIRANKAPDHEEKELKLSMDYYTAMGNWEEYDKNASKYIKKYASKSPSVMNDVAWNYFLNINNTTLLKKATDWAYTALNMDNKYTYNLTYAYLLYKQNIYKEAEKACDYAIIRANAENVQPTSANALKDAIKKSTAKSQ